MYLQKVRYLVISKKIKLFVGVVKVTEEKNRIRIR
jgi:hypothetical protein